MMLRSSILTQDILVSRSPGSPEARQQNILAASPSCAVTLLRHEAREITPRLRLWAGSGSGALSGWPTHPARGRGSVIGNIINWSCLPIKMSSSVKSRKHYQCGNAACCKNNLSKWKKIWHGQIGNMNHTYSSALWWMMIPDSCFGAYIYIILFQSLLL